MLKEEQKLHYISYKKVLKFIKTSDFFNKKRHDYEQEIVKWQINYMKNDGENWICDPEYGGDFFIFNPFCDLGFRKGVVDTLSAIGMDLEVIEEGIEKNANLWREQYMKKAFRNEFEPIFDILDRENFKNLPPLEKEHQENWLKIRKYEYYKRHKNSVDKYGIIEPEMKLTKEEVQEINDYLENKKIERLKILEQFKTQNKKHTRILKLI